MAFDPYGNISKERDMGFMSDQIRGPRARLCAPLALTLVCLLGFGGAERCAAENVPAVSAVRTLVGKLTFQEEFLDAAGPGAFPDLYPRWKTNYYFGNQSDITSRGYVGTISIMLDGKFAPQPTVLGPMTKDGHLNIFAYRMAPAEFEKYGKGGTHPYAAGVVTTEKSFAQAFGYFEVSAKLPDCSGTRPAFWLLPVAKTPENGGRLAEIDVFEHYGGPITVLSGGTRPVVIDRVGKPVSTLHYGTVTDEKRLSNAQKLPPRIDLSRFHTFGLLWTPTAMSFYIDQAETWTIANPGVVDPHYLVLSLDVLNGAGDPANCRFPSAMIVDYVRAWTLR